MREEGSIGVLSGGDSPEREVSLVSGQHVYQALCDLGHAACSIEIDSLDDLVRPLTGIAVVFNCLHGGSGEDGTVQLLLDVMNLSYTGSDAQACARSMDKVLARKLFSLHRIPIPNGLSCDGNHLEALASEAERTLSFPLVVKPTDGGSTIGVSVVRDRGELYAAAAGVLKEFGTLLVEEYVPGRELTVGILRSGNADAALPVVEIRPPNKLFDYQAKYTNGVAEFLVPAPLPPETERRVQATARLAHRALGCYGFSRVDLRLGEDGTPYVLELNTIPGITPMSTLPRAAGAAGISYVELVERLLQTADKEGR